jgi:hypothetical protein
MMEQFRAAPWLGLARFAHAGFETAPERQSVQRRAAGEGMGAAVGAGEFAISSGEAFVWKSDRAEVMLSCTNEGWLVQYSTVGRLLGPPQMLHEARHRDARHAAWDVMARVQNASNNEAEMIRAGHSAVRWIKAHPQWREPAGGVQQPKRSR